MCRADCGMYIAVQCTCGGSGGAIQNTDGRSSAGEHPVGIRSGAFQRDAESENRVADISGEKHEKRGAEESIIRKAESVGQDGLLICRQDRPNGSYRILEAEAFLFDPEIGQEETAYEPMNSGWEDTTAKNGSSYRYRLYFCQGGRQLFCEQSGEDYAAFGAGYHELADLVFAVRTKMLFRRNTSHRNSSGRGIGKQMAIRSGFRGILL